MHIPNAITSRADNQLLAEFGVKPEQLAEVQAVLNARSMKRVAAKKGDVLSLAESIPRSKRRKIIPDEYLPKVAIVGESNSIPDISCPSCYAVLTLLSTRPTQCGQVCNVQ